MIAKKLKKHIEQEVKKLELSKINVGLEHPAEESHGDYATNVALKLAGKKKGNFLENIEWIFSKVRKDNFEKVTPRNGLPVGKLQPQVKKAIGAKSELIYLKPRVYAKIRDWWKYWKGHPEITQEYFYLLPAALYFPQQVLKDKSADNTYLFVFNFKHIFVIVVEVEKKPEENQIKTIYFVQARRLKFFKAVYAQKKGLLGRRRISSLLAPRRKAGVAGAGLSGLQESQVFYNTIAKLCQENILDYEEKLLPKVIAERITQELRQDKKLAKIVAKIEIAGPGFINFWLRKKYLINEAKKAVEQGENYGSGGWGKGKTVIVDYSSPNIAKRFSIGHLRSTIIGQAIYNIYKFLGWKVIGDNHLGDWGTQFGKLIIAIKKWSDKPVSELDIDEMEKLYVKFHKEAEKDTDLNEQARKAFKNLEDGKKRERKIWKQLVKTSMQEFQKIYDLLDVSIDVSYGESFYEKIMPEIIQKAKQEKVAVESEKALIIPFPGEKLAPGMLLKKDGATTYFARDLATIKFRIDKWKPDLIIYEVGAEQTLHFRQVFWAAELLGMGERKNYVHIPHGLIRLKEGKMSTRKGKTIKLEEVLDKAVKKAKKFNTDDKTARTVGIGAIKYNDLKKDPKTDYVFDWDEILNLEGNSGPYLQYTYARCKSVLRKSQKSKIKSQKSIVNGLKPEELSILRTIYKFPEVVLEAGKTYSPNLICNFLFDLAQRYNSFYNKHKIIGGENENLRIGLTAATAQVLKNGLHLLGIKTLERM